VDEGDEIAAITKLDETEANGNGTGEMLNDGPGTTDEAASASDENTGAVSE
jgi:hypothetical protein